MEEGMRVEAVPGLLVAAGPIAGPVATVSVGTDARGMPLAPDTPIPVASVTKLATALAVLRLADRGRLAIDDPLGRHVPEAAASGATLRALLTHTAELPPDLPDGAGPYDRSLTWSALAAACVDVAPGPNAGRSVEYSNVGAGLLAVAVERRTGRPFPDALRELVLEPLDLEATLGAEPPRPTAAIGGLTGEHAGTELESFNTPFWRSLALPWGGLVATAADAVALVRAFAGHPVGFLREATRAEAVRNQTGELGGGMFPPYGWQPGPWGLGPELR